MISGLAAPMTIFPAVTRPWGSPVSRVPDRVSMMFL